jgi:poly(A) polymerase
VKASRSQNAKRRALEVVACLRAAGHEALFAGGCVRDLLLTRVPEDYDVATSARPEEVRGLFPRVVPVGERFGVELVIVEDEPVEVATFRRDCSYGDGRRPDSVVFADDAEEDARRRDFTVNGLFMDAETGEVYDHVGGLEDLEACVIRAIGDPHERFGEDRLRMLRAVRFACNLGFDLDPDTRRAVEELAPAIQAVSWERKRDEILRILVGSAPAHGLRLLLETGLLVELLPEVCDMVGVEQPPEFHPEGDVFLHTCLVLEHLSRPSPVLAVAALLHDVGKPGTFERRERIRFDNHSRVGAEMAGEICRRMKLGRHDTEDVVELVRSHLRFMEVRRMREARLRRFLTSPLAEEHLALHRADCLGSHGDLTNYEFCIERRRAYLAEPPPVERLLSGRDLIGLGMTPGPRFAEILREVEDLQLEGRLGSREEALELVRSRFLEGDANEE